MGSPHPISYSLAKGVEPPSRVGNHTNGGFEGEVPVYGGFFEPLNPLESKYEPLNRGGISEVDWGCGTTEQDQASFCDT